MGARPSAPQARLGVPNGELKLQSFESVDGDATDLCVAIETRTTAKDSHEVTASRFLFQASASRELRVGASPSSEVHVSDPNVQDHHATIRILPGGAVEFVAVARSYHMLPPPEDSGDTGLRMAEGQIVKMGACSVQVMAVQLPPDTPPRRPLPESSSDCTSCDTERALEAGRASVGAQPGTFVASGTGPSSAVVHGLASGAPGFARPCSSPSGPSATRTDAVDSTSEGSARESDSAPPPVTDDALCYICMGGVDDDALVGSPCSCRSHVHRSCLKRWVETRGNRNCSICKDKLPFDATVDPPYVVFQVIRHMRGLQWHGEREYVLSFAGRAAERSGRARVVLGSHPACDIRLPDPSMSKQHAAITFDAAARSFHLNDLHSRAGTFLKVEGAVTVVRGRTVRFKFARTTVSVELGPLGQIRDAAAARRVLSEAEAEGAAAATTSATAAGRAGGAALGIPAPGPAPEAVRALPAVIPPPLGGWAGHASPAAPTARLDALSAPSSAAASPYGNVMSSSMPSGGGAHRGQVTPLA